ncbi:MULTISPECIES: RICIN domain-containing protein [unclassified Amycolatopsis]|uniref:RICIN domain-containing protein n=1 Tax=unclassified Amycolatopsis TaxID=2618356 RepID=UPI002E14C5B9|nr:MULTISPECIES: RICIN domain-containing protein [unclassified Amycolatopsis]WSK79703.1 RICIN domain-containing protein [Amycolatopsis sp. NBC_01286]
MKSPVRRRVMTVLSAASTLVAGLITVVAAAPAAQAAITPDGWYTVAAVNSGKCVDARAAASANGTVVQQYSCNQSASQEWQFQSTGDGYFRVNTRNNAAAAWDVTGVSTADGGLVQLWSYSNGLNQQWQAVDEGSGRYHFVNRNSGKCLDVPSASTADSVQLQQYSCNNTSAQSFTLTPVGGTTPPTSGQPDLGPNVVIFDPSMSSSSIQSRLNGIFSQQERNQFGSQRYAVMFKPGTYSNDVNVGFYTQVLGLGLSPDAVTINGAVHVEADWFPPQNATQNFWRGAENLSVNPTGGADRWAVSQAAPYRRMHVRGDLQLDDGGWASGGWISDSKIDGQVRSGSQQQWISRNSQFGSWNGSNWNMVFAGVQGAPSNTFPSPPYTTVASTPVVREKPFLYIDNAGNYQVFVPGVKTNASGTSWANGTAPGTSLPIDQFYIAKPGATAADMNAALAAGKNLLVTPGVYHLNQALHVTRPDTVVLGLGIATLVPDGGVTAMNVDDVNGVKVAGLLIDAGTTNSNTLMQVGAAGSTADHSADPTSLHDVFFRIGGPAVGKATNSLVVNSNNVIGDHMWIWRADHADNGNNVGWTTNTADNGLTVNGNNVTMYGLFVEHYQKTQVVWNGNGGRTYFFQNEMPYDVPNQAGWMNGSTKGYSAYKVGPNVTSHEAWGLGSYCFFSTNPSVASAHAFEAPNTPGVKFHDMVTVSLNYQGTITHVINTTGDTTPTGTKPVNLVSYP